MPICNIDGLLATVPPGYRLMGLDLGSKTLGLALSDSGFRIASPIGTIRRTRFRVDAEALFKIMDERDVGGLVLGLPVNMDGSEGPRCQSTRQFAHSLLDLRDVPLVFWDERLSSRAVERAMIGADMSRAKRGRKIDEAAAAYILQGALDRLGFGTAP
ncbi:MAG: Holliday junction resolvase RuvX [Inquilinaceae bacterium]